MTSWPIRRPGSLPLAAHFSWLCYAALGIASTSFAQEPPNEPESVSQDSFLDGSVSAANDGYVVALASEAMLNPEASWAQHAVRASLMREAGLNWMAADARWVGYPEESLVRVARGFRQLEAGLDAFESDQLANAVQLLREAVDHFDEGVLALASQEPLGKALLHLGAAQVRLGQRNDARETFLRMHREVPDMEPSKAAFGDAVVNLYRGARPRGIRASARLRVESTPPGGLVFLNRYPVGTTPLELNTVAPGDHSVRVTGPQVATFQETASLRAGVTASIEVPRIPDEARSALSAGFGEESSAQGRGGRIAEHLGVEQLALMVLAPGERERVVDFQCVVVERGAATPVASFHRRSARNPAEVMAVAQQLVALASEVMRGRGRTHPSRPPNPALNVAQEERHETALSERAEFWITVGSLAAALVGGISAYAVLQDREPTSNGSIVLRF